MTAAPETALERPDLARLREYLADETAAQEEALAFLVRKEKLLIGEDVPGLRALLQGAEPLLARLEELTRRRARILATLARKTGLADATIRLRDVAARAAPAERADLDAAVERLRDALRRVAAENLRNAALARQASAINRALLHVLLGGAPPVATYGKDGATREWTGPEARFAREA